MSFFPSSGAAAVSAIATKHAAFYCRWPRGSQLMWCCRRPRAPGPLQLLIAGDRLDARYFRGPHSALHVTQERAILLCKLDQREDGSCAGCLEAVAALHRCNVVHGSIGSGSFMVNTLEEARASSLVVKADNLGFGQIFSGGSGPGSGLDTGKRSDRGALAVTFCELAFSAHPLSAIAHEP